MLAVTPTELSLAAIVVSAGSLIMAIATFRHQRSASRPGIDVSACFGFPTDDFGRIVGGLDSQGLAVTVHNRGPAVPETITAIEVEVEGDATGRMILVAPGFLVQSAPLPVVLSPGQFWAGLYNLAGIRRRLAEEWGVRPRYPLRVTARGTGGARYSCTVDLKSARVA